MLTRLQRVSTLLDEDAARDLVDLHARDRAIGLRLAHLRSAPHRQVLAWAAVRDEEASPCGPHAAGGTGTLAAALWLTGTALGVIAATGALYFEGGGRVNVVALLALLVGLQLLSVVFTLFGMLPAAWRRRVPGLGALVDGLSVLSPARAAVGVIRRWFPGAARTLGALVRPASREARLLARVRRWMLWRLSQGFAVAFNLGLTVAFIALVVFTDLAFGWSTTLDVSASTVRAITSALSAPWRDLVPGAVPTPELVEQSRHFRAVAAQGVDAALLGGWWPFVLACLLAYGLVPRLALWCFAGWRFRRAMRWTIEHLPGTPELLYRLNNERVSSRGEASAEHGPVADTPPSRAPLTPASGPCDLVAWGAFDADLSVLIEHVQAATGLEPVAVHRAGGASIGEDRTTADAVAANARPVVVAVKAWEPPLAELLDFLGELRRTSREARMLLVVPVPEPGRATPAAGDVDIWRESLSGFADPWLGVRALSEREPR
jgi:hypothetical protein